MKLTDWQKGYKYVILQSTMDSSIFVPSKVIVKYLKHLICSIQINCPRRVSVKEGFQAIVRNSWTLQSEYVAFGLSSIINDSVIQTSTDSAFGYCVYGRVCCKEKLHIIQPFQLKLLFCKAR